MALGAAGPISAIGYVFDEDWAARNRAAARGFIAASREAKALLRRSDAEWEVLREMTGAKDDATLVALRDRFREGIPDRPLGEERSEEHTSELQSLMRISYAVFCLKKKKIIKTQLYTTSHTCDE